MNFPINLLSRVDALRSHGDAVRIAEASGLHAETIRKALREAKGSEAVVEAIAAFYAERETLISAYVE